MKRRVPRALRSILRRSVFAVDGSEVDEQRSKRHRESGDRLRRTAGLHLPIQSKGAKCDSRRPKIFRLALQAPDTAHTNRSLSTSKERISQNHKKHKITFSPLVILFRGALSRSPRRGLSEGWCTHRQADRPLPHLAAAAPTLPVATRKTTRLSRQSPLLFVRNAPLFVPSPHAGDTTRALASRTQRVRNSCLHPSPSHLSI